jgi:FlaA1/EpsC-like NDP-sugar epimerase
LVLEAGAMGKGGVKSIFLIWVSRPETIDLARKMIKLAGFIPEKTSK